MEITGGEEEGFVREWTPCSHMLSLIPPRVQTGLFSNELCLTCIDAVSDYIALGTNIGLVYWYDRKKGNIQRLRCETSSSPITYVKIANTVDYMVGAGNAAGQVTVFQIPKEHPDNIPDNFKPKVEPKVERYTIGDLHKSKITAIEWSKNGMRLFSGDKNGVIIMSEIDFYMHLCKSQEIVNEGHEIVQLSHLQGRLLVSSVYRSIVCERRAQRWAVAQVGKKERKALSPLGAVWQYSYARGGPASAYCARAGLRLWRAGDAGDVLQTLLFKEAVTNPLTIVELLNPAPKRQSLSTDGSFGALHVFREHFLVSHDDKLLYILDPRSLTAVAVVDNLRRILSVSVNKDEIFVLEGPRSVLRLGAAPEPAAPHAESVPLMSQSLRLAARALRGLAAAESSLSALAAPAAAPAPAPAAPHAPAVARGEECFELPPIKHLPNDISENVLESIINEFRDVTSETEELRRIKSEELKEKLKLYNRIMEKKYDEELIHSRRSRRKEVGSAAGSRGVTPVGRAAAAEVAYTSPCVMNVSIYSNLPQETDDVLEKQIEEKEKILAKMLNLESLSIKSTITRNFEQNEPNIEKVDIDSIDKPEVERETKEIVEKPSKKIDPSELVPKLVELPNTWNLGKLELKLDISNGYKDVITSPDDHLEGWELV